MAASKLFSKIEVLILSEECCSSALSFPDCPFGRITTKQLKMF
jgi:hypothetical protein